ncbi:MAG: hypothetical protein AABX04_04705 [Nanoarchaeota archaeon]
MDKSEKEITWIDAKQTTIERTLLHSFDYNLEPITLSFPIGGITFRILTNNLFFVSHAKSQFETSDYETNNNLVVLNGISKSKLKFPELDQSQIMTPHIGFYDEKNHYALTTGKGYGLFKSLIIGFASAIAQEKGYHPAHASFIELNGRGIMLTGSHKAGKTTSLMHLMQVLKEYSPKILTDDWVLTNENDGAVFSLEDNLSFSRTFCEEFSYLNLIPSYEKNVVDGLKKVYVHPDEVFGESTKINKSKINTIVMLEPVNRTNLFEYPEREIVVEYIINGTYHMPDCNPRQVQRHRDFWMDTLSNTQFFSFDTRHKIPPYESYIQLCNELK